MTFGGLARSNSRRSPVTNHRQIVGRKTIVTRSSTSCSSKSCRSTTRAHSPQLPALPPALLAVRKGNAVTNPRQRQPLVAGSTHEFPLRISSLTPETACAVTGVTSRGTRMNSVGKPSAPPPSVHRRDVRSGDARMAGGLPSISLPASGSISRAGAKERQRALTPLCALPANLNSSLHQPSPSQ